MSLAISTGNGQTAADHSFVGTGTLLRFMLRRDRIRLPAWTLGITLFWLYYTRLIPTVYPDLDAVSGLVEGPMGRLYTGPGHGFDDLDFDRFIVGAYGLYVLVLVALMSLLLVVRHTRLEEQAGRSELVRASVVGRHAPMTAALLVACVTNAAVTIAVALITATSPEMAVPGSLLFAAGVGATGLVFAAVAAIAAQLTEFSRTAAGLAGGALGAAFAIRALGDMAEPGGSLLSWFSPLAWAQQTGPFVLDRWWPLVLSLGVSAVATAAAYSLAAERDLGAGMLSTRPGPARAPDWLGSPVGLAVRLQRASIIGWAVALTLSGALFGAWADVMADSLDELPEIMLDLMGGADDVVAGYLALMALFMALLVGVFVVLAVHSLRSEETSGRGEPVLATPVSRLAWLGSYGLVTAASAVLMLVTTGIGSGVGAAVATGDPAQVWDVTLAHLVFAPAVLIVLAVAVALFGIAPRWVPLTWALLGWSLIAGLFGELMDLPGWVTAISPFGHGGRVPLDPVDAPALVVLSGLAVVTAGVGLVAFRRRSFGS
jgi:ABC-2 type transport system permease protein